MSATVIEAQDGASRVVRARATVASFTAARYAVILADPPWEYRAWKGDRADRRARHATVSGQRGLTVETLKNLNSKRTPCRSRE